MSERGACEVVGISRSVYHSRPTERKDEAVIEAVFIVGSGGLIAIAVSVLFLLLFLLLLLLLWFELWL